jgi:RNA polymerase sigma-70 factor (ECF subfamily)
MDQVLFQRWLEGDEQSFRMIYRLYYPRLCRFAAALVGDPAEGEDLAQEVFLRVRSAGPRLQEQGVANGRALLYTIARRLAYQYSAYRARWDRLTEDAQAVQEALLQTDLPLPDQLAAAAETGAYIDAALNRLPEPQRELLLLRYREQLGFDEIAPVVGGTGPLVKARLHHARTLLYAQLRKLRIALDA